MVAAESSPALLKANRRLLELRKKIQADKTLTVSPWQSLDNAHGQSTTRDQHSQLSDARALIANFPQHLGWGSAAVTKVVRASQEIPDEPVNGAGATDLAWLPEPQLAKNPALKTDNQEAKSDVVKLYPDLALGMLQCEQAAAGRIWLLLRYLDQEGRGWLPIAFTQEKLTANDSELRVCGRRQLRNLLHQGRGVFWERDKDRVWLKSAAKVAKALGVKRLSGRPVQLPVKALLGGIGQVRAHFYASFHSGRQKNNPITRDTLRGITGIPKRTQRQYEQIADVKTGRNIAIGERYTKKAMEERAWHQGQAAFRFYDKQGKQGAPGQKYVAWQMPNSYDGPHSLCCKGRQKKINRKLRELVMKGMRANGREKVEKLFWPHGAAAGKAFNKSSEVDAYWESGHARVKHFILWRVIPGRRR